MRSTAASAGASLHRRSGVAFAAERSLEVVWPAPAFSLRELSAADLPQQELPESLAFHISGMGRPAAKWMVGRVTRIGNSPRQLRGEARLLDECLVDHQRRRSVAPLHRPLGTQNADAPFLERGSEASALGASGAYLILAVLVWSVDAGPLNNSCRRRGTPESRS